MRKVLLTGLVLVASFTSFAQTILSGSEIFGEERKKGFYMTINIEKKFIEKDWSLFISKYGGVNQSREVFNISAANIPDISPDPINLTTKVTSEQKLKTKIFASFDLGGGNTVSENSKSFISVEKLLKDFYAFAMHNEDIRLAEHDAEESQKNFDRVNKTGNKLARDIEKNKREKEKLLKEIDENGVELEKLLKDQIANKQDQENAQISQEEKQNLERLNKTGDKLARDIKKNKREKEKLLKEIEENRVDLEKLLKEQIANKQDQENARISLEEKQKAVSMLKTRIK